VLAPGRVALVVAGAILVLATLREVVVTLVVPRRPRRKGRIGASWLAEGLWWIVGGTFELVARRAPGGRSRRRSREERYLAEDSLLGRVAAVSLVALLGAWILLLFAGFSLMVWGVRGGGYAAALDLTGSSLLTLGVRVPVGTGQTLLAYLAAGAGLVVLALEIGYLPTIYGHYSRRETQMRILEARAGRPAWGPEILMRQHNINGLDTMPDLYASWEAWSAETMESHLTFPWLMLFRSSDPLESWITSLLAVLDAAAMQLALCPEAAPSSQARQCLRMGFTALRRLAEMLRIDHNPDPPPDEKIALTLGEFSDAVDYLSSNGFALERTAEQAWADFHGWRVNYEQIAHALVRRFHAPPALWSGASEPIVPRTVRDRTYADPQGTRLQHLEDRRSAEPGR
jgi:hypothetical protein